MFGGPSPPSPPRCGFFRPSAGHFARCFASFAGSESLVLGGRAPQAPHGAVSFDPALGTLLVASQASPGRKAWFGGAEPPKPPTVRFLSTQRWALCSLLRKLRRVGKPGLGGPSPPSPPRCGFFRPSAGHFARCFGCFACWVGLGRACGPGRARLGSARARRTACLALPTSSLPLIRLTGFTHPLYLVQPWPASPLHPVPPSLAFRPALP
ncbi:hypothetical protein H4W33_005258 [Kibdelosporangium phytohabitans]|nr:hypothetical protein [Kibdelosporangium phytohabitans]